MFLKYSFFWIVASVIYFFASEQIAKLLFPGFDNEMLWLYTLIIGLSFILIITIVTFFINKKTKI